MIYVKLIQCLIEAMNVPILCTSLLLVSNQSVTGLQPDDVLSDVCKILSIGT